MTQQTRRRGGQWPPLWCVLICSIDADNSRQLRTGAGRRGAAPYGGKVPICHCEPVRTLAWQSASPVPFFNVFKWQFENTAIFNFQFSIFNSPGAGRRGRPMTAPTAGVVRRGIEDAAPHGRKVPICHCEPVRTLAWQSASPVPFFNVLKWQFENTAIFIFQFSIFNSPGAGRRGQPMTPPYDGCGQETQGVEEPPPMAGRFRSVIARPVRRLVVAIRIPRPLFQCFQMAI